MGEVFVVLKVVLSIWGYSIEQFKIAIKCIKRMGRQLIYDYKN